MATAAGAESGLVRAIGVWGLAAAIVNVTVGGGIFRLPASVASSLGAAAPLAYLVCAVAMGLIVLCFAEAGSRVSLTGGPYAYVELAFGPFVGFLAGVLLWSVGSLAVAAVATVLAANVAQLVPALQGAAGSAALLVTVFAVLGAVNVAGVRHASAFNAIATAAKLLPLVLLLAAGAFAVRPANPPGTTRPLAPTWPARRSSSSSPSPASRGRWPRGGSARTPPGRCPARSLIAMLGITLLYVGLQIVAQGVLGADLAVSPDSLADAAGASSAPGTHPPAGASVSMFGYVSGMTLAIPRAPVCLRPRRLPSRVVASRRCIRGSTRRGSPSPGSAWSPACWPVTSTFERLAILANLALLLLYATCCLAAWQLRRRGVREGGTPFTVAGGGIAPIAACLVIAWMLTSIRRDEWAAVGGCLVVASAAFLVARARPRPTRS
jgi:amino acid transporter